MAICTICGKKYSKFTTPVSAKRVCSECFFAQLETEASADDPQPAKERPLGRDSQPVTAQPKGMGGWLLFFCVFLALNILLSFYNYAITAVQLSRLPALAIVVLPYISLGVPVS